MRMTPVFAAVLVAASLGQAFASDTAAAVRAVILDQLDAFLSRDLDRAFAHASPAIQRVFRTPDRFGEMVQRGYPMVWAPVRFELGALEERHGRTLQTVLFETSDGRVHEARYEMRLVGGTWRIDGVTVETLPGLAS